MTEVSTIAVMLVDDHPLILDGLRVQLQRGPGIAVTATCGDAESALDAARATAPDVAIIDIGLPGTNGLSLTRALRQECPRTRVVILSMHDDEEYVMEAIQAGVSGYILKDVQPESMADVVRAVVRGDVYFSPGVSQFLMRQYVSQLREPAALPLAPRERQVLTLIAEGHTSREVAAQLSLSIRTVETYRERLMKKLDLHSVADLTRHAIAEGLVTARQGDPRRVQNA